MGARSRRRARRDSNVAILATKADTPPPNYPIGWWQAAMRLPGRSSSAAVEACVGAISQTVAMLPIYHYRERDDGGTDRVLNSPAARVLHRPNDYQSRADFFLNLVRAELMTGNGYAIVTRDARFNIDSLRTIPAGATHPYVEANSGEIFYSVGSYDLLPNPPLGSLWTARDVLHIRLHTNRHPLIGVTPLAAAATAVETSAAINNGIASFMTNLVRPSGFLSVPQGVTLGKEVAEQLRSDWTDNASGGNQGRLGVLMHGIEWKPMEMDAFDEAVVKAYAMTTADIARVFRVPLPVINELGGATFNNSETLLRHWHATGLGFMLEHIELALDNLFGLPPDEFTAFDVEYILRSDFLARMDGLTKAVSGGIYSPNEARHKEGLSSVAHGDEPRLQAQVVPLSAAAGLSAPTVAPAPAAPAIQAPKGANDSGPPPFSVAAEAARILGRLRSMSNGS